MAAPKKSKAGAPAPAALATFEARRFVHCGMRLGTDGKRFVALRLLKEDGALEAEEAGEKWFEFKPARDKHIGGIYEGAEFSDSQVKGLDVTRLVGKLGDLGQVAVWTGKDSKAREQLAYEKYRKEATRVGELEEFMRPLRKVYEAARNRYDMVSCRVLERAVLDALRTSLRKYEEKES